MTAGAIYLWHDDNLEAALDDAEARGEFDPDNGEVLDGYDFSESDAAEEGAIND